MIPSDVLLTMGDGQPDSIAELLKCICDRAYVAADGTDPLDGLTRLIRELQASS